MIDALIGRMAALFADGAVVDWILALMILELMVLILIRKKLSHGLRPLDLAVSLGAGGALLLALRAALEGSAWQQVAVWLIVALGGHLWDLKLRWSARRTP